MQRAVDLIAGWCRNRPIPGLTLEVHQLPGRTPLIVVEVPASGGGPADDTVLLYGHLDKQPEMEGWRDGLGPWTPVLEGDRLYGRGSADDGYAAFASLTAIEAIHAAGGATARCVVLIEASEESGSPDLPAYVEALADRIGRPSLVVCLDSGCIDYDRMWVTTSLRGLAGGVLSVDIVTEGLHSGDVSGMIPSSFRIGRSLLSRIEDEVTGDILLPALEVEIPADRVREAAGDGGGGRLARRPLPVRRRCRPDHRRRGRAAPVENVATGAERGRCRRPPARRPGRQRASAAAPVSSCRCACPRRATRSAPSRRCVRRSSPIRRTARESRSPAWSRLRVERTEFAPWLVDALDAASTATFGEPSRKFGEGGTIPFMGMLGERFPDAQFVITGVIGPDGNAHGPNEYLHIPTARRITGAVALLLDAHARRER